MAGDGVGELHLNGIKVRILTNFFESLELALDVEIILFHLAKEPVALLTGQRRGLRGNGIEQDLALQLGVVVVRERKHGRSEAEAVKILETPQAAQFGYIAVGQKIHRTIFGALRKMVVVLDDHQQIAALDLLLGAQHVTANTVVVAVRPFVGTGDDDGFVASVTVIAILQLLHELTAFYHLDIREIHPESRYFADAVLQHAAYQGGVEQNTRFGLLAHHFIQRRVNHLPIDGQSFRIERRGVVHPDRRKLRIVAHENQPAALPAAHVTHQIVEKRPAAEDRPVRRTVCQHRSLVHDEHGPPLLVDVEREFRLVVGIGALAVDPLVNGQGRFSRITGQHLGRPSRRSQQHGFDAAILERPDQSGDQRRLSGTRVTVQYENGRRIAFGQILGKRFDDFFLTRCCIKTNFSVNLGRNMSL